MVEEYMGFEKYGFIKDNAALFEAGEQEKIKMQIQQDIQMQQQEPSTEESMLQEQINQVDVADEMEESE
jgi:alpha-acetolactate decarboxylase